MNFVIVFGRLGRDPERRSTRDGRVVCNLRVATDFKSREGETRTEWHDVVVWGETARACADHLKSGRQVAVQGRLQTRSWDDDAGQKRWRTEIVATRVEFISGLSPDRPAVAAAAALPF